ncbi:MAG: glycoside hydrolase family 3 protein, partial [Chloroflexi bacterium]|nr:glycoside hydrolase family 3 protein [Chloroflexota bacterium]
YNVATLVQTRALISELQSLAAQAGQRPLLIAVDQEGGQLNALGTGTTQFAGNMALGATRDADLVRRVGQAMGRELAAIGVNINYAPNCDLGTNPKNPACGARAFSDDPMLTAEMATAFVTGMQSEGVAATIKHFPGKGDASVDSHYHMPLIDHSRERMDRVELRPFRAAIDAGAKLIMTGHFSIPALTGNPDIPATLSRAVMHDLVRNELGFGGVVITDALDMGAISQGAGQIVDVIAALRAEVDLMLLTYDAAVAERIYAGLQLAYSREIVQNKHLTQSLARVQALKTWAAQFEQPSIDVVACAEHQKLAQELAERSITLVRNEAGLLPLRLESDARVAVITPTYKHLTPADTSEDVPQRLATAVRVHHPCVDEFITNHSPEGAEIAAIREKVADYDLIIVGTISASMNPDQAALVNELLKLNVPMVTVALRTPYDITVYPEVATHLCTYSILPPSMTALAKVLWGEIPTQGKLPVTIAGLYSIGHGL